MITGLVITLVAGASTTSGQGYVHAYAPTSMEWVPAVSTCGIAVTGQTPSGSGTSPARIGQWVWV